MRWARTQLGEFRTRRGFLWLPKDIADEVRWLEFAIWTEKYGSFKGGDGWIAIRWELP